MTVVPKSQKARGIMLLPMIFDAYQKHSLFDPKESFAKQKTDAGIFHANEMFARPCPTRPRHGFVESKVIRTAAEASALLKEARAEDPDAELLITTKINAISSAVLTLDGILNIGPDHDGATSGRGAIQLIVPNTHIPANFLQLAGIKENGYIESVCDSMFRLTSVVQFRDGPKQNTLSANYIPKETIVKNVIVPCESLLEWEKVVSCLGPGDVVYGSGHGLTSHAAVHCVLHEVPFITEFEPKPGDTLKPEVANFEFNAHEFEAGRALGREMLLEYDIGSSFCSQVQEVSLAMLHAWPRLQYNKNANALAGYFVEVLYLLSVAAISGECRYTGKYQDEGRNDFFRTLNFGKDNGNKIETALKTFDNTKKFQIGYGGPSWGKCASLTKDLHNAICTSDFSGTLKSLNLIVNQSHNSGLFLDKFFCKQIFDDAGSKTSLMLMNKQNVLLNIFKRMGKAKPLDKEDTISYQEQVQIAFNGYSLLGCNSGVLPKDGSAFFKYFVALEMNWTNFKAKDNHFEHKAGNLTFKVY